LVFESVNRLASLNKVKLRLYKLVNLLKIKKDLQWSTIPVLNLFGSSKWSMCHVDLYIVVG